MTEKYSRRKSSPRILIFPRHSHDANGKDRHLSRVLAVLSKGTFQSGNPTLASRRHVGRNGRRDPFRADNASLISRFGSVGRLRSGLGGAFFHREKSPGDVSLSFLVAVFRFSNGGVLGYRLS